MPRRAEVDWAAVTAAAPHGNIRRAHLRELGVADSTIAGRIQAGRWVLYLPGLIRLTTGSPTDDEILDAVVRYAGDDAVVSGTVAARRHGLRRLPADDRVLVLKPAHTRRQATGPVLVERTGRMPTPVLTGGWPLAPLERTVIDTARLRLRRLDDMRAVLAEAVQRGFTTPASLRHELESGSQRGTKLVRIAMTEIEAGVRSTAEAWAREIAVELEDSGFPPIRWNHTIVGADGRDLLTPDGWVDDVAMAWEIESLEFHLSPDDQERSYRRRALMRLHDVEFVEHRPSALLHEPAMVRRDLWAAYRRAQRRPRPPVTVRPPRA